MALFKPQKTRELQAWRDAPDYTAIIQFSRRFLRGDMKTAPYNKRHMKSETAPLVAGLLTLHKFGILTFDGQPSGHEGPKPTKDCITKDDSVKASNWHKVPLIGNIAKRMHWPGRRGSEWTEYEKLPFIHFIFPTTKCPISAEAVQDFINLLRNHPLLMVRITYTSRQPPVLWDTNGTTRDSNFPLTRKRSAPTKEQLSQESWECVKQIPPGTETEFENWGCPAVNETQPLDIWVAQRWWGDQVDLVEVVKTRAEHAGIPRAY